MTRPRRACLEQALRRLTPATVPHPMRIDDTPPADAAREENGHAFTPWLSVRQVVDRLNGAVSRSLLYDLAARGEVRSTRLGGKLLIDWRSVEALLSRATGPEQVQAHGLAPEPPPPQERPQERPRGRRKDQRKGEDFPAYYARVMEEVRRKGRRTGA